MNVSPIRPFLSRFCIALNDLAGHKYRSCHSSPMSRPHSKIDDMDKEDYANLVKRLLLRQHNLCYICRKEIDEKIDKTDVDHIIPISHPFNGLDEEQNWGVVHRACNESKSNRSLELMRYIYCYRGLRDDCVEKKGDFTVGDALDARMPTRKMVFARMEDGEIALSYAGDDGISKREHFRLLTDNGTASFVGMIPFDLLHHDKDLNPRSIADLEPLIQEFYHKRPQLQPSLAHMETGNPDEGTRILLFDGQHKAAAQLFNNKRTLFARVFVNSDIRLLKETNFRAHTALAQIHFPDIIQDKVGHDLFNEAFGVYRSQTDSSEGSESQFTSPIEDAPDYRRHLKSYLKYECLFSPGQPHRILEYVETVWTRSKKFPLVYDTLDKSFFRFFLCFQPVKEPIVDSQKYRMIERENLSRLMTIFVEEMLDERFETKTGIFKLEQRLEENPDSITDDHLVAYRICRAAPMVVWTGELKKAITLLLRSVPGYHKNEWPDERPLWIEIPEEQWVRIRRMFTIIRDHQIWKERTNRDIINEISSTKQKDWREILLDGRLPDRNERLFSPLTYSKIHELSIG